MSVTGSKKLSLEKTLCALRELKLFQALSDDEFRLVVAGLRSETIPHGRPLVIAGEANTNLYIVRSGALAYRRLTGIRTEGAPTFLRQGAVVNLKSYLTGGRNEFSLEAESDAEVAVLQRASFVDALRRQPEIERKLDLPDEVKAAFRERRQHHWLVDGEKVEILRTRHWWWLAERLIALPLPFVALAALNTALPGLPALLWLLAFVVAAAWAIWQFVDWRNDFYCVTSYRVVHRERVLMLYDEQQEAALDKVQNTSVRQNSLWALLFDYGDVTIETAGVGAAVTFRMIHQPRQVSDKIITLREQTKSLVWATERQRIRSDVRVELRLAPRPPEPVREPTQFKPPLEARIEAFRKALRNARHTVLPRARVQEGDRVTYRKHWLRLVETAGPQFVLFLLCFPILFLCYVFNEDFRRLLGGVFWGYSALTLAALGWLVWKYEDWRNDIYVLDKDRVIDIDRSPFGLLGTQQKEARYDSIQNVLATTRGALDILLKVGDVAVKTGGADNALVFERVYDPFAVQRELQGKIDAFKSGQQQREREQRRREIAEVLGVYDELSARQGQRRDEPEAPDDGVVRY